MVPAISDWAVVPNFVGIAVSLLVQGPANFLKPWPLGVLLFGLLMLLFAVIGTITGKVYGKGGTADRATNPFEYWLSLIIAYLGAAFLIWHWLYALPH